MPKFVDEFGLARIWQNTKDYVNEVVSNQETTYLIRAPVGTIVIWSGTTDNIPTGWHLCDGDGGTPDLRDKFVLGAGTHEVGETGGSEEVTLTVDQIPSHTHDISTDIQANYPSDVFGGKYFRNLGYKKSVAGGYSGFVTSSNGGSESHNNMPPYYTLCYIMKLTADETDGITMEEVDAKIEEAMASIPVSDGVPIGTLHHFLGKTAPKGYLSCNGSVYDIADYPELADFIEKQYGSKNYFGGNGTTNFALPNMLGKFLFGYDTNHTIGTTGGEENVTLTVAQLPTHVHSIDGSKAVGNLYNGNLAMGVSGSATVHNTGSVGANQPHNNMPPYFSVLICIKAK